MPTTEATPEVLADRVDAALRRAGTEQQPVLLDAGSWIQIRDALRAKPDPVDDPRTPFPEVVIAAPNDDGHEVHLDLYCRRCSRVFGEAAPGDALADLARLAATHDDECLRDRVAMIDELANAIRAIDGNHQLGAGDLAERLVNGGWIGR